MTFRPMRYTAVLFAVAGAALALGVGAALPVWRVPPQTPPQPEFSGGEAGLAVIEMHPQFQSGTLLEAVCGELSQPYILEPMSQVLLSVLALLVVGAGSGLLCRPAWLRFRAALSPPPSRPDPVER